MEAKTPFACVSLIQDDNVDRKQIIEDTEIQEETTTHSLALAGKKGSTILK